MVKDSLPYRHGHNQEANDNEEDWNEKSPAEEIQLFLHGVVTDSGINRQSGQEGADDVRQVDQICKLASHRHYAKHGNKITRLIILELVQNPSPRAAYSYQDQRHKDGHLNDLQGKTRWRKTFGVG